ncbi:MAG: hypothetical protein ABEK59_12715 [Halobacteria archaeon]
MNPTNHREFLRYDESQDGCKIPSTKKGRDEDVILITDGGKNEGDIEDCSGDSGTEDVDKEETGSDGGGLSDGNADDGELEGEESDVDKGKHLVSMDKGLSNTLYYDSEEDAIIKNYDINPGQGMTQAFAAVAYGVKFKPDIHTKNQRMKKEIEMKEKIHESIDDDVVNSPEVKERRPNSIVYEHVDGMDAREYLEENPEYAYVVGKMVGEAIDELNNQGISQVDSRPSNWMITTEEDGLRLYLVDNEYSDIDMSQDLTDGVSGMIDRGMFLQGIQQMDAEVYRDVKAGMIESVGEINDIEDTVKAAVSVCNAALIEKDGGKLTRAAKNGVGDAVSKIGKYLK